MSRPTDASEGSPDSGAAAIAPNRVGPALVLASAVLFSFSGMLTKAIDAGSWTILGWRGVIGGVGIAGYVWFRQRHHPVREVFRLGRHGWLLAVVGGIGSVAFIFAFKNTLIANVSVIYATIPFVAALLERLILGETLKRRTLGAASASAIGVAIIVGGSLGSPNLDGDAVAITMVVLNALFSSAPMPTPIQCSRAPHPVHCCSAPVGSLPTSPPSAHATLSSSWHLESSSPPPPSCGSKERS